MNDDLPMNAEMASAYLDGELDAADRATAAADPDTMALVDSFAQISTALGEIGPVDGSTRTAAMAAALAEFDAIHGAPAATPAGAPASASVTSLQSRRLRRYRLITGAAAAAVAVVVGVAALNASRDADESLSSATEIPAAADAAAELPTEKSTDTAAVEQTTAAAGAVFADSATAVPPEIGDKAALAQYASDLDAARSSLPALSSTTASPPVAAPELSAAAAIALPDCLVANQIVLGPITFQGTPAFAIRDSVDGTVQAIDAVDCRVLESVDP